MQYRMFHRSALSAYEKSLHLFIAALLKVRDCGTLFRLAALGTFPQGEGFGWVRIAAPFVILSAAHRSRRISTGSARTEAEIFRRGAHLWLPLGDQGELSRRD